MKIFFMMHKSVETDLYNKKCEIINSLIELIELRTKYRFNFDFKFIRPDVTNLQCSTSKAVMLPMENFCDNYTFTRGLIDLIKSFLLNNLSNFIPNNEKIEKDEICERDSYLVELVDELEENELCRPNIENAFSELMSKNVLNDSLNLIKKYDIYAENLVNEIFNDFGKEIDHGSNNDSEIEIKIKLPSGLSYDHGHFQRRHSADMIGFSYKSDHANPTLPNIAEDCLDESDLFWRRHSLNNPSYKMNKSFNNTMPIIIVDFEDDFDGKWSSRSSLDKPRLSDSECELNNNQFKQYTKVTLKNLLNKSPNSKKNKNELLQSRNEDLLKETALKNSEFCKSVVEDIVANSMNTVQSMIKKYSELAQNLVESSVDDGLDEMRKIIQIRKINELYLKCDCVNMNQYCRKKDRLDCKLLIYLICSVLEEMNFTNSAIFECKNYQLMKKLTGLAFEIYETHSQKKKLASSQQFYN
ncbi:hypothetical protein BpHYR1_032436, partial [Brachionus plicatilis]